MNDKNAAIAGELRPMVDAIISELHEVTELLTHLRDDGVELVIARKCTPIVIRPTADCERSRYGNAVGEALDESGLLLEAVLRGVRDLRDRVDLKSRSGTA